MTVTTNFFSVFGFGGLYARADGSVEQVNVEIGSSQPTSSTTMSFAPLMPPPPPPPEGSEPIIAPSFGSIEDVLLHMAPVSISISDMLFATTNGLVSGYTDLSALSVMPAFAGTIQYDLGMGPLSLDIIVVAIGPDFLAVPIHGTLPPITDQVSLDAFVASISAVIPDLTSSPMLAPVVLNTLSLANIAYESSDQHGDGNNESFSGTDGYDYMFGGGGSDAFYGGDGHDWMQGAASMYGPSLRGAVGDDELLLAPSAGDDVDYMYGGAGNDIMIGDDQTTYMNGGADADHFDGTMGYTIADYSTATSRVNVHLPSGTGSWGEAEGDTYVGIEEVIGSAFDDRIGLNGLAGEAHGGEGHDRIFGLGRC